MIYNMISILINSDEASVKNDVLDISSHRHENKVMVHGMMRILDNYVYAAMGHIPIRYCQNRWYATKQN